MSDGGDFSDENEFDDFEAEDESEIDPLDQELIEDEEQAEEDDDQPIDISSHQKFDVLDSRAMIKSEFATNIVPKNKRRFRNVLNKYEKTKVLSMRIMQLEKNAEALIEVPKGITRSRDIAQLELEAGVIPFIIVRKDVKTDLEEHWELSELIIL